VKKLSERDINIANLVLRDGETIKSAAIKHGISLVRARQIIHRVCRTVNATEYERGFHTEKYVGGRINDKCLPYLSFLRENSNIFLPH
jgi:hypothetical protein